MVLTPSTMLPLGTKAPDFRLEDVTTGKSITLETFKDAKVLLVMFICRHCPYVQHIKEELAKIARSYLRDFTLDESTSERKLLEVWLKDFGAQLEKSFAE